MLGTVFVYLKVLVGVDPGPSHVQVAFHSCGSGQIKLRHAGVVKDARLI